MAEHTAAVASFYVSELSKRLSEPAWMRTARESAWEKFSSLPSPRLEKTDLSKRPWEFGPFPAEASGEVAPVTKSLLEKLVEEGSPFVYVRDGFVIQTQLPPEVAAQGIHFTDLSTALSQHSELVQSHFGTVVKADESKWAALNTALWHGGVFLYVPRNVTVDKTFHFIYEETPAGKGALPRVLIVGEDGSSFSYAEVFVEGERASGTVHSHSLELVAKANTDITIAAVNHYGNGPTNYFTRRARVANDARVNWVFGDIGDGFTVGVLESDLQGSGSNSTVQAVGLGYGRQHLDLTASMLHSGKYSTSDIVMHGVIRERANSIYRSSTHIFRNAVGAGSEQHDRMMLLSPSSRADAIPMLLIDENDVQRCGHAASVGRIDENQIYYLMSRGIPKEVATKMIVWGHLQPTVEAVPSEAVRAYLTARIDRELA